MSGIEDLKEYIKNLENKIFSLENNIYQLQSQVKFLLDSNEKKLVETTKNNAFRSSKDNNSNNDHNKTDEKLDDQLLVKNKNYGCLSGFVISVIKPSLLMNGNYTPITANTPDPIPFENDIFKGLTLFLVNTGTDNRLDGTKYKFEVQVQGTFKKLPSVDEQLFVGAEITKKMELGMITKGLSHSILQLGRAVNPLLHHSFGDKNNNELPHITGPLWSSVDRLVITKPGETPPVLGHTLEEDPITRSTRKKNPSYSVKIELGYTYSFSLKTSNIDLEQWNGVNLPFINSINLHTFWGNADIRLVFYGVSNNKNNKFHLQSTNHYYYALEIKHKSNYDPNTWSSSSPSEFVNSRPSPRHLRKSIHEDIYGVVLEDSAANELDEDDDEIDSIGDDQSVVSSTDEDGSLFFDTAEGPKQIEKNNLNELNSQFSDIIVDNYNSSRKNKESNNNINLSYNRKDNTSIFNNSNYRRSNKFSDPKSLQAGNISLEIKNELGYYNKNKKFVVSVVEVDEKRPNRAAGARRTLYAIMLEPLGDISFCVLRSFKEWEASLPIPKIKGKSNSYKRLDESGQRRVLLENSYREILSTNDLTIKNKFEVFLSVGTHNDSFLLAGFHNGVNSPKLRSNIPTFSMHSLVCVKLGNYYWSEEYMGINNSELVFIKHNQKALRISLSKISKVKMVEFSESEIVMPGIFEIIISTFSRQYQVMVRGAENAEAWVSSINKLKRFKQDVTVMNYNELVGNNDHDTIHNDIDGFSVDLMAYPKGLKLGDKVILNCRNYSIHNYEIIDSENSKLLDYLMKSPLELVSHLLDVVLTLNEERDCEEKYNDKLWIYFMDGVSLLQAIDISYMDPFSDDFVGIPTTINKWTGFFNHCSYEAFGDFFSLAELEHCIIRRDLHKPNIGLIVNQYIPYSEYDFFLRRKDYRLVWAINYASSSQIPQIPIYRIDKLNIQLETVTALSLNKSVIITDKNIISLSQLFRWYRRDFEVNLEGQKIIAKNKKLHSKDLLAIFLQHASGPLRDSLYVILGSKLEVTIKYFPIEYVCRPLERMEEH